MSKWSVVLDEVTDYLNSLTLTQSFTAINSYKPKVELNLLLETDLSVIVFPMKMERILIDRSTTVKEHGVAIAITKKIDGKNLNLDTMVDFVEEIAVELDRKQLTTGRTTNESIIDPVYDTDKLVDMSMFQSIIQIIVKVYS